MPIIKEQDKLDIVFEQIPFGQYADKLTIDLAGGLAQDVFHYPGIAWPPFMRRKLTYVLDELLKRDNITMSSFDLAPDKLCGFEGKLWGLPYALPSSWGMAYNERIFKEAGVDLPKESWIWDDWLPALQKTHKPPDRYGMTAIRHLDVVMQMVLSNGGQFFTPDEKKILIDQPVAIEAVQWSVELLTKHKVVMAPGEEKVLGDQIFASDKLAMMNVSVGDVAGWKVATKDHQMPAWVSTWPSAPKTKKLVTTGQGHTTSINAKTKILDQAWMFFSWWHTQDGGLRAQAPIFPVNYNFPKYLELVTDPTAKKVANLRKEFLSKNHNLVFWGPKSTETQQMLTAELDNALLGKKTPEQAMKDAAKSINDVLAGA